MNQRQLREAAILRETLLTFSRLISIMKLMISNKLLIVVRNVNIAADSLLRDHSARGLVPAKLSPVRVPTEGRQSGVSAGNQRRGNIMSTTTAPRAELTMGLALVAIAALVAVISGGMRHSVAVLPRLDTSVTENDRQVNLMPEVLVTAEPPIPVLPEVLITAEADLPVLPEVLTTAPRQNQGAVTPATPQASGDSRQGIGGRPFNGPHADARIPGAGLLRRSPALARPTTD
jgi:hypothetical protein